MPELRETQERHAKDVIDGNVSGLMSDFTPNALNKAMAIASNPITATSFEIEDMGENEAKISYIGNSGRRVIWSKWIQVDGVWKIDDVEDQTPNE